MTKLEYTPDVGIKLNSSTINWLQHRGNIRKLIDLPFEEEDKVIDLGDNRSIQVKRDIYENVNSGDNYFFLNYNSENLLTEIEVQWGVNITVNDIDIDFKKNIRESVNGLCKLSHTYKEIEPGNYLFPDLKLTIADQNSLGGDGHNLGYFYASTDISHLNE